MKDVLYVGNFKILKMNAAGKRVISISKLISQAGYNVKLLGVDSSNHDTITDSKSRYDDTYVYCFPSALVRKSMRNPKYLFDSFIDFCTTMPNLKLIILYGCPTFSVFNSYILKYAKKNGIKVIADVVDWLKVDSGSLFFRIIKQLDTNYRNAIVNNKVDGIIAISSWLKDYYLAHKKVQNIIVIPPLSEQTFKQKNNDFDEPQLLYAGIPFRFGAKISNLSLLKDRIDIMLVYIWFFQGRVT